MARLPAECVEIRDGRQITIRPIDRSDASRLSEALQQLSPESRYRRFLTPKTAFSSAELRYLTDVDHHDHEALVALDPDNEDGIAVARFVRSKADRRVAEAAITVADEWQNRGVGHALLQHLTRRASEEGVQVLSATVLESNDGVIALLSEAGPLEFERVGSGAVDLRITLAGDGVCPAVASECLRAAARGDLKPKRHVVPSEGSEADRGRQTPRPGPPG